MKRLLLTLGIALAGLAVALCWRRAEPPPYFKTPRDPAAVGRFAVLIGASRYYHLKGFDLDGPANDVGLTRKTLTTLYDFPADQIVCLSEDEADPYHKPTRANIERALKELAAIARDGDQMVVLMAGHGSRQPQPADAKNPEPDGIDEIFLPADVAAWVDGKERCPGAIVDDEIGEWLAAVTAKGAYVWAVFDCCHSGTITRGSERVREVELVPEEELRTARERAAKRGGDEPPPLRPAERLVALYACAAHETTPEGPQPEGARGAKTYGLLTYTVNAVLRQAAAAGQPLTYREVTQRVQQHYLGRLRGSPSPAIEGSGAGRLVFEMTEPRRPPFTFRRDKGPVRVNGGDLHGLTVGSVVAAYPAAGVKDADQPLGHARVTEAGPLEAVVEPAEWQEVAAKELPDAGRCAVVYTDYSLRPLRVTVVGDRDGAAAKLRRAAEAGLCTVTADAADFVLHVGADAAELLEASGHGRPVPLPAAGDAAFGPRLTEALEKIHRAKNLVAVAGRLMGERSRGKADVSVEVVGLRRRGGQEEDLPAGGGWVLRGDDGVRFRLKNTSVKKRIQVTLMLVSFDQKIEPFYPAEDEVSKALAPGEAMETPWGKIDNKPPFGDERLVVIATPAQNPAVDFRLLVQAGVRRGFREEASPLAVLLERAMHGVGSRGGLSRGEATQQSMQVLGWRTEPRR